ncbi:MAG: toll/interleukin-1 receptor domain-containing protein [Polyangiaceae bacterium]|nr:toll/interleukin-1 receptor domain-containing protein [Polyangiaceae bacterium]
MGQGGRSAREWTAEEASRIWDLLTGVIDFGDRLDFVFLELSSSELETAWPAALKTYCTSRDLPIREPEAQANLLDWLEKELARGQELDALQGKERPRSLYIVSLVHLRNERYILARLNENRDRLVSALSGTFCLVGVGDFVRRIANNAPSVWAMRARAFVLGGMPPPNALAIAGGFESAKESGAAVTALAAPAPPAAPPSAYELTRGVSRHSDAAPDLASGSVEVLMSVAPQDLNRARELQKRLPGKVTLPINAPVDPSLFNRASLILLLISPAYLESVQWKVLENALEQDRGLQTKLIPLLIVPTPIPGALRSFIPLRLLNSVDDASNLPRLMDTIERLDRDVPSTQQDWAPVGELSHVQMQLDDFPLDWNEPGPQQLNRYLALMYPDWQSIKLISQTAGISLDRVGFQQSPLAAWRDVLESAAQQAKLRKLINCVLSDRAASAIHTKLRELTDA